MMRPPHYSPDHWAWKCMGPWAWSSGAWHRAIFRPEMGALFSAGSRNHPFGSPPGSCARPWLHWPRWKRTGRRPRATIRRWAHGARQSGGHPPQRARSPRVLPFFRTAFHLESDPRIWSHGLYFLTTSPEAAPANPLDDFRPAALRSTPRPQCGMFRINFHKTKGCSVQFRNALSRDSFPDHKWTVSRVPRSTLEDRCLRSIMLCVALAD
jgi:hypothetical protein